MNTLVSFLVCADDRVKNVLVLLPFLPPALRYLLVAITSSTAM